jgi:hypothetical protein
MPEHRLARTRALYDGYVYTPPRPRITPVLLPQVPTWMAAFIAHVMHPEAPAWADEALDRLWRPWHENHAERIRRVAARADVHAGEA